MADTYKLKLGTETVRVLALGEVSIRKAYLGEELIFDNSTILQPFQDDLTNLEYSLIDDLLD